MQMSKFLNNELDSDSESDTELIFKWESDSDSEENIVAHKWCVIIYLLLSINDYD